ncbi:MAG TPA: glycine--tRNA ligase [Candidatus Jacksonbacteria bacterium]|nr:glycine--tRNA ligase [Candidatus Jacksonbacteria bacterium]
MPKNETNQMQKIVAWSKRRGFVFPGSEIYGGLANSWDFGPLGAQLKRNIRDLWWQYFVVGRDDILGLDGGILMNPRVWEASGHLAGFNDALIDCKACKSRFRADHLIEEQLNEKVEGKSLAELEKIVQNKALKCPSCKADKLTAPRQFNLMFKTFIGTVEDATSTVYLRPETAQSMFVNFKNILDSTRVSLPFGLAQQGKAFRNEITPGNFIFRVLEFEQMEIEYFIQPADWEKYFKMWEEAMSSWLDLLGIQRSNWSVREHQAQELSHYSKRTIDFEYNFPFGTKELYGLAYRTDFDLRNHEQFSGQNLHYQNPVSGESFIPHVIEPTFGVERSVLAVICDAFEVVTGGRGEASRQEEEVVLRFDRKIAPVKVAIFPLIKKELLIKAGREVLAGLRNQFKFMANFVIAYDEAGSIGRRYRRQDEIGTPYCVTIDFETLDDQAVTVRDRDTMNQERVKIAELGEWLEEKYG